MTNELQKKSESLPVVEEVTPQSMMLQAYKDKADPETLEKFMLMAERAEDRRARLDFISAKIAFDSEVGPIVKTKGVDYTPKSGKGRVKFDFADLAGVKQIVDPVLQKNGFTYSFKTTQTEASICVTCRLFHISGHEEENSQTSGHDNTGGKNSIQAIGSSNSYLRRYSLLGVLGLSTEDDDGNGIGGTQTITAEQKQELIDLLTKHEVETKPFLEYGEVSSIDEILAHHFEGAKAIILKRSKLNVNS